MVSWTRHDDFECGVIIRVMRCRIVHNRYRRYSNGRRMWYHYDGRIYHHRWWSTSMYWSKYTILIIPNWYSSWHDRCWYFYHPSKIRLLSCSHSSPFVTTTLDLTPVVSHISFILSMCRNMMCTTDNGPYSVTTSLGIGGDAVETTIAYPPIYYCSALRATTLCEWRYV